VNIEIVCLFQVIVIDVYCYYTVLQITSMNSTQLSIGLKETPSHIFNNLTCNGSLIAYAHGSEILLVNEGAANGRKAPSSRKLALPSSSSEIILHIKWHQLPGSERYALVIGTSSAAYVIYNILCLLIDRYMMRSHFIFNCHIILEKHKVN
jgi:hypothetical protein